MTVTCRPVAGPASVTEANVKSNWVGIVTCALCVLDRADECAQVFSRDNATISASTTATASAPEATAAHRSFDSAAC
jgi:hypothetical protein